MQLDSLNEQDWPLFLHLYQDPEVQRYIADPMDLAEIRARFESRLMPWERVLTIGFAWLFAKREAGNPWD